MFKDVNSASHLLPVTILSLYIYCIVASFKLIENQVFFLSHRVKPLLVLDADLAFYSARNCIASAVLATAIPSVCLSVCLSVCPSVRPSATRRYCVKTTARSTMQFPPLDSKMCLVLYKPKNIRQGRPLPPEILAQSDLPTPEGCEF